MVASENIKTANGIPNASAHGNRVKILSKITVENERNDNFGTS